MAVANIVDDWPALRRYVRGERLGGGASGETFAAVDVEGGGACVVKVFSADVSSRAAAVAEFRGLVSLSHPNIVRVLDVGRLDDGRLYLVTGRVAGDGIDSIATIGDEAARRSALEAAARDLASALAHLHARGLVHGDICPANVRLGADGRAVLIDFGLAGPPMPGDGGARGTLGYAAPEALTGARTPAVDLFALGATLFEAFSGAAPFGRGLAAVGRMLAGPAPTLSTLRSGLPAGWDALMARLLADDPARRPSSAREVLREVLRLSNGANTPTEVDLGVPYPDGDPLVGIVVGRLRERAALRGAIDRLADGAATESVVTLLGPSGAGRRTLFDVVVRDVAIAAAAGVIPSIEIWRPDTEALDALVGLPASGTAPAEDHARASDARMARIAEALEARGRQRPLCVWLDEGDWNTAFAAFVAGAPPSGRVVLVVPARAVLGRPFENIVALEPLSAAEIGELVACGVDVRPPAGSLRAIAAAAQGNTALAAVLARRLVFALRAGGDLLSIEPGADLDGLLASGFAALSGEAQAFVLAVALVDSDAARAADLDEMTTVRARAAARAAGWTTVGPSGDDRLPSAAHRRVVLAASAPVLRRRISERALARLDTGHPRRPDVLAAAGRAAEAAIALRQAAAAAARDGAPARAALLYERSLSLAPDVALTVEERLTQVTGLGLLGRYPDAAQANAIARGLATDASTRAAVAERDAWLRARRGDIDGARRVLEDALSDGSGAGGAGWALRARLGRLRVTAGRFREALEAIGPFFGEAGDAVEAPTTVRALAIETAILAHAYMGEIAEAKTRLGDLDQAAVSEGRRCHLAAVVAQLGGDEAHALESYRRAYEVASGDGDVHTVAAVALNLGGLLAEQGLYGEALAANERAVRELGRLGAMAELRAALVNAANLLAMVRDLPAARRVLARAGAQAQSGDGGRSLASAAAAFVEADIEDRAGQPQAAARLYRAAASAYLQAGQCQHATSALSAAAEAWAAAGRVDEGRRVLDEASKLGDDPDDDDLLRARGRLHLLDAAQADGPPGELAARLLSAARRAQARARRPRAWRLAAVGARIAEQAGDAAAAQTARQLGRSILEEVQMSTPERHRAGLAGDPDAIWLSGAETSTEGSVASRALAAEAKLRRLLRINKRLNSELRLPRLLEMIVDTVIELTDAERGFLLIEDDKGELTVKVARNIDQQTLETAAFELSRSIARQAAIGGEPIVTIDAAGDARFREAVSVSDLHLRSVLAVPLVIKGRAAGTIYVDHRLRKGAFDQDDVRLVLDFAEQAAIALENARLLAELRRRERQIEALNRRLEVELAARREELSGIKQELRDNREALAVRYDYHNIIGRTPRMLDLFRLLDRITDTTLPVVIQGESGTGKELVARAIHTNGPRRGQPFVGENCAAIPETLLESTLFGYVRGAFTGAEHDTRGLFEVADGGTLFLDEVGEMSPAMQGKLLRVLQEGELRRVGSERTRKVDVRILAATNRDLARMVEEGKFRRDLFFRLNVAQIALPALRERRDDIPLMVTHFLTRLGAKAGRAPKPLDPAALGRLVSYRWPGNVRELENEITRADALSGDRITLADLSPQVAAAGDPGALAASDPDSLLLRPRVERLERSLLREALGRAANNQTKAAEMLGLSRFGLQKKLKRYSFA